MKYLTILVALLYLGCKGTGPHIDPAPNIDPDPKIVYGAISFDGVIRDYEIQFPEFYYSSTDDFPLVIFLHGYGSSYEWAKSNTLIDQVAYGAGYVIVGPEAIDNAWNSGIDAQPGFTVPDVDDVGFINAMIDKLIEDYNIDPDRIYVASQMVQR